MKNALFVVCALAIGSLATVACGGAAGDESSSTDDAALSAAGKTIVGTWGDLDDANAADINDYSFTFNSNGTFKTQGGCRPNPTGPSCFAITASSGKFKITKSGPQLGAPGGAAEIELTDTFGQKTDYFYSLNDGELSLSTVFRGKASVFTKATPPPPPPALDAKVVGTWGDLDDANAADILDFGYTFNKDGSFSATGGCRPSGPGKANCFAISKQSGSWSIGKSGPQLGAPQGASEIELVDTFGQKTNFFYSVDGDKLSLSTVFDGKSSVFTKSE